jgi:hypothetical protein
MPNIDPRLLAVGIEAAPQLIGLFRDLFVAKHPDAPVPTSEEVIATFEQTFTSSLAIDDAILAAPDPPH